MNMVQKIISRNGQRFFYIRGTAVDGLAAWYFVLLKPSTLRQFMQMDRKNGYNILDYGDVITSGYGDAAPDDVIKEMNDKYNCSFSN